MPGSTPLRLKMAIATFGHTAAIKDGSIPIEGVTPEFVQVEPQIAAYRRMVRDVEFDVCEIAPSTYMIAREHGAPFKALPIFVSRYFHHSGFVYRPDAGISKPKDLEGKHAGVRAYSVTTGVWGRGILQNEYGIDITKITWWVDDEEHVTTLKLPPFVKHVPQGKSLVSMMAAGELQAGFTGNAGLGRTGAPKEGWAAGAAKPAETNYVEFFKDSKKLEAEWFKRTGIYPFHGTIVVKDSVLKEHPWVAKSLFKAYTEAKERYVKQLPAPDKASGKDKQIAELAQIVGDPLPYGIKKNLPSIEALIKYVHQQGMLKRSYQVSELFVDPEA
jgi:4,5-dihydroxyphthalate decarboxylase